MFGGENVGLVLGFSKVFAIRFQPNLAIESLYLEFLRELSRGCSEGKFL